MQQSKAFLYLFYTRYSTGFWLLCRKKEHYIGYKLYAVCTQNGVIHSFDLTPANVHHLHYLKDVKYQPDNCTLIGDKGYINADYQLDLFTQSNIKLAVPMRKNQVDFMQFFATKGKMRKELKHFIHN